MCQYTPDNKRTKNTNQTKMCAIMVFYVYFVLYIELLFGNVGLNRSLEKLNDFTDISSNDDLNDIKFFNVGKYRCSFNGVAATVLNSPFNTAFTMEAFQSAGTPQYIAQKAIEFESGHCKWRMRDTATGTIVQDWVQLY
jgi:hypothetical protein